jgi:hypothetical protein
VECEEDKHRSPKEEQNYAICWKANGIKKVTKVKGGLLRVWKGKRKRGSGRMIKSHRGNEYGQSILHVYVKMA